MARKIASGFVIGLSSILLVLSIVGIAAAWIYNKPLKQEADSRLTKVDVELAAAQTALHDAQNELERTLRLVDSAQETLTALSKELGLAKGVFDEINGTLDDNVIPSLQASRDKIDEVKSALESLRDSLKKINDLPFVNLNLPGDEALVNLISIADSLDARIVQVEDVAKKASTFASDISYLTGGDLTETRQHLQSLLDAVTTYDQKVTDWRAQVASLMESVPVWIDRASIIVTIFLLWFGFSQFSLFLHGLSLWRGDDPLAVLRQAIKEARAKSSPV